MTTITRENIWFNKVQLSEDEELILSFPANHTQGKRAVGGKLFITNTRMAFAPNRIDANLRGQAMELSIPAIVRVDTAKPVFRITEIFSGAIRIRLSIHTNDKYIHYFVVGKPKSVADKINTALNDLTNES